MLKQHHHQQHRNVGTTSSASDPTHSIKMDTLHIDGEENYWSFHGMNTLGHDRVTSYEYFTKRLMDISEINDPEMPSRELALLRQTRTPEAYILEFQQLDIMVTSISKARLILLFIELWIHVLNSMSVGTHYDGK